MAEKQLEAEREPPLLWLQRVVVCAVELHLLDHECIAHIQRHAAHLGIGLGLGLPSRAVARWRVKVRDRVRVLSLIHI